MKINLRYNVTRILQCAVLAAMLCVLSADATAAPNEKGKKKENSSMGSFMEGRDDNIPTKVTALSMDVDLENNIATLLGSVYLNDQRLKIHCDKMVIILEEKQDEDPNAKTTDDGSSPFGNKQPSRIECYGNVDTFVPPFDPQKPEKEFTAKGDKMNYDFKTEIVELFGDGRGNQAIVIQGKTKKNEVHGNRIYVYLSNGELVRTKVVDGTLTITDLKLNDQKKDKTKSKDTERKGARQ